MKLYTYSKCETCRKAVKWLKEREIIFEELPIRQEPPSAEELRRMLLYYKGEVRRLFNTSGMDYRSLGIKDKLLEMSDAESIALLSGNGNLIKRPFLITSDKGLVGFHPAEWEKVLSVQNDDN